MDLSGFMKYWSLTLAVFVFYVFAILVASLYVMDEWREAARKRRAGAKGRAVNPDPLADRTVAATVLPGPGQLPDAKRAWVASQAGEVVRRVSPTVKVLVLEDSKGHPFVHFSDEQRLQTYRLDRSLVDAAMAGETARLDEVKALLERHLVADFLGREAERPPRTTELAREAGAKPAAPPPPAPVAPASSAPGGAPSTPGSEDAMSREERIAAARAKAEALRKAREPD